MRGVHSRLLTHAMETKRERQLTALPGWKDPANAVRKRDSKLEKLLADIRAWSPRLRRNQEETYKSELRERLNSLKYHLGEEKNTSRVDLVVDKVFAIETKKEPQLSDYDRAFGQIARHLEDYAFVIMVIFDVPSEDKLNDFTQLVDKYFNEDETNVFVLKK